MCWFRKKDASKSDLAHGILYPAATWDYSVTAKGKFGFGLLAARNMKKGEMIFSDSVEFTFADVVDGVGDHLIFNGNRKASRRTKSKVPTQFPLTRDVLSRTHGVPVCKGDNVFWNLEVPGMLMNHSCDPNVKSYPRSTDKAEDYATRDIKKGEELTVDYVLQYYDQGPFFNKCKCGSSNCRKKMMGFKALSDGEKEKLFPMASDAVQAMHMAAVGKGPQLKHEQPAFPPRAATTLTDGSKVLKMVFPGPSHALADVMLKQNDDGKFALYAAKDFKFGERVYEFWSQPWPVVDITRRPIELVFASKLTQNDPTEGTVIRLDPFTSGAPRDRSGNVMFSGFDLFTVHSCDPNLVYDDDDEGEQWCNAYAARDIRANEQITVDYNCLHWDRSADRTAGGCSCGAAKCAGTNMGFKFLSEECREERKLMSWKRIPPPYEGEDEKVVPGEALFPHVRVCWRKDSNLADDAPETGESSDGSSSSSED